MTLPRKMIDSTICIGAIGELVFAFTAAVVKILFVCRLLIVLFRYFYALFEIKVLTMKFSGVKFGELGN